MSLSKFFEKWTLLAGSEKKVARSIKGFFSSVYFDEKSGKKYQ